MSVTYVKSARARKDGKPPFRCTTCTQPIEPGQAYAWSQASRFAMRYSWHQTCAAPRASVLEGNEKTSTCMAAFEDADEALSAIDLESIEVTALADEDNPDDLDTRKREALRSEIESIGQNLQQGIQDAADMYHESASNIEDGFGHATEQSEQAEENATLYEDIASNAEQVVDELDFDYDPEAWDSWADWAEDVVQQARDAFGALEEHP